MAALAAGVTQAAVTFVLGWKRRCGLEDPVLLQRRRRPPDRYARVQVPSTRRFSRHIATLRVELA